MKPIEMIPYGTAFVVNGYRVVFSPHEIKKGKNKGKLKCYYRKGKMFKKIILNEKNIKKLEKKT